MAAGQAQTGVDDRHRRFQIVRCDHCGELTVEGPACTSCGTVWSREGLVSLLIELGVRKPEGPMAA